MKTKLTGDKWKTWGGIASQAQKDPKFKKRLLVEPAAVVKEHGLEVPTGYRITVTEKPDKSFELTFTEVGGAGELTQDDLERVAGGKRYCETKPVSAYYDLESGTGMEVSTTVCVITPDNPKGPSMPAW